MIWYSETAGSNDLPAVIALHAHLIGRVLRTEALYINAPLPAGEARGTFVPKWGAEGWSLAIEWPDDMPFSATGGRIHPVDQWTPERLITVIDGVEWINLTINS